MKNPRSPATNALRIGCRSVAQASVTAVSHASGLHPRGSRQGACDTAGGDACATIARRIVFVLGIFAAMLFRAHAAYVDFHGFFERHCVKCHSGEKPKGDLVLDTLTADFAGKANLDRWREIPSCR